MISFYNKLFLVGIESNENVDFQKMQSEYDRLVIKYELKNVKQTEDEIAGISIDSNKNFK